MRGRKASTFPKAMLPMGKGCVHAAKTFRTDKRGDRFAEAFCGKERSVKVSGDRAPDAMILVAAVTCRTCVKAMAAAAR